MMIVRICPKDVRNLIFSRKNKKNMNLSSVEFVRRLIKVKCSVNHFESVKSQKFLGNIMDENLNWTSHVDCLCAAIFSRISLFK